MVCYTLCVQPPEPSLLPPARRKLLLLLRSRMKDTGLMALPLLAKAWMMWFCMTHSMQKLPW